MSFVSHIDVPPCRRCSLISCCCLLYVEVIFRLVKYLLHVYDGRWYDLTFGQYVLSSCVITTSGSVALIRFCKRRSLTFPELLLSGSGNVLMLRDMHRMQSLVFFFIWSPSWWKGWEFLVDVCVILFFCLGVSARSFDVVFGRPFFGDSTFFPRGLLLLGLFVSFGSGLGRRV